MKIKIEQGKVVNLQAMKSRKRGIDSVVDTGSRATAELKKDDTLYVSSSVGREVAVQIISLAESGKLAIKIHDESQIHEIEDSKGKKLL